MSLSYAGMPPEGCLPMSFRLCGIPPAVLLPAKMSAGNVGMSAGRNEDCHRRVNECEKEMFWD